MRVVPRSLAGRLALLLVVALLAAQALAFALFARERVEAYREAYRESVGVRLASLVRLIEDSPPELHDRISQTAGSALLRLSIDDAPTISQADSIGEVSSGAATRLAELLSRSVGNVRVALATDQPRRGFRRGEDAQDLGRRRPAWLVASVRLANGRWLNAATERPPVPPLGSVFLASLLFSALSVACVGAFAVRRLSRPLRGLADAADRLGRGEPVEALTEDVPDEARRLVAAFNAMRERLDRTVRDRTAMLAAVAHDLRTPITTLRLRAEFIEDEDMRLRILGTLDEMEAMAETSLAFARGAATSEPTRATDLGALVGSAVQDLIEQDLDVRLGPLAERLILPCRPLALRRALTNLIENAVTYGGTASVGLTRERNEARITVDDDGRGIPTADLERVFEPFVRLEASRSRETGGAGLGLSLARSTARGHGGEVQLKNRVEGGLRATIVLPLPSTEHAS